MSKIYLVLSAVFCILLSVVGCDSGSSATTSIEDVEEIVAYYQIKKVIIAGEEGPDLVVTRTSDVRYLRGNLKLERDDATHASGSVFLIPFDSETNQIADEETPEPDDVTIILVDESTLSIDFGDGDGAQLFSFSIDGDTLTLTAQIPVGDQVKQAVLERVEEPNLPIQGSWAGTSQVSGEPDMTTPLGSCIDQGETSIKIITTAAFEELGYSHNIFQQQQWNESDECEGEPSSIDGVTQAGYYELEGNTLRWWIVSDNGGVSTGPVIRLVFTYILTEGNPDILTVDRDDCDVVNGGDACIENVPTQIVLVPAV